MTDSVSLSDQAKAILALEDDTKQLQEQLAQCNLQRMILEARISCNREAVMKLVDSLKTKD